MKETERETETQRDPDRDDATVRNQATLCLRVIFHTINEQRFIMDECVEIFVKYV